MYLRLIAALAVLAFGVAACTAPVEEVMVEEVMEEEPMEKM